MNDTGQLPTVLGAEVQAGPLLSHSGRVRLRTLIWLRWIAIIGQTGTVFVVYSGLGYDLPLALCLLVIGASVVLNVCALLFSPPTQLLSDRQAAFYLAYDIFQLALLLYLTGGLENPFALLFLAPITISASMLNLRTTVTLGFLVFVLVSLIAVTHWPLPWRGDEAFTLPQTYRAGLWAALLLGIGFTAGYARRVAAEAARMGQALAATQLVLTREQSLAALGGLAAAAAHELGTPLATIRVVATELARDISEDSPYKEDIALLNSQAERCRIILGRLSQRPDNGDAVYARQPLSALLDAVVEPYLGAGLSIEVQIEKEVSGSEPVLWRRAEIVHALASLMENAADFAHAHVVVKAAYDADSVTISLLDDGPGFAAEILSRLGEPYVTSRPRKALLPGGVYPDSTHEHEGMGLGFFIAKTLLEHTGGIVHFCNHLSHLGPPQALTSHGVQGAMVTVSWRRNLVEASPLSAAVGVDINSASVSVTDG